MCQRMKKDPISSSKKKKIAKKKIIDLNMT